MVEARQFGGTNLSASQFARKINRIALFSFTSIEVTTKKFCYLMKAMEKTTAIVQLILVKVTFKIVKCSKFKDVSSQKLI